MSQFSQEDGVYESLGIFVICKLSPFKNVYTIVSAFPVQIT